jgi:hypothetical protein
MIDRTMLYSFGSLIILFIGCAYIGWSIADDIWWRGPLTFAGAFIGSALWFVGMFAHAKWKTYKGTVEP